MSPHLEVPPEIWDKIFRLATDVPNSLLCFVQNYHESERNLSNHAYQCWRRSTGMKLAICRVSRRWNVMGTPLLYENIIVPTAVGDDESYLHTDPEKRQLEALIRTLTSASSDANWNKPHIGTSVRGVDWTFPEDLTHTSREDLEGEAVGKLAELVACLPNLEVFTVRTRSTISPMATLNALSPHLKHLHWRTVATVGLTRNILPLSYFFEFLEAHPSLQTVDILHAFDSASHNPSSWGGRSFPSIRHWVLRNTQVDVLATLPEGTFPGLDAITYPYYRPGRINTKRERFTQFLLTQGQHLTMVRLDAQRYLVDFLHPLAELRPQVREIHLSVTIEELGSNTMSEVSATVHMPGVVTLGLSLIDLAHFDEYRTYIHIGPEWVDHAFLRWKEVFPNLRTVKFLEEIDVVDLARMRTLYRVLDHYKEQGVSTRGLRTTRTLCNRAIWNDYWVRRSPGGANAYDDVALIAKSIVEFAKGANLNLQPRSARREVREMTPHLAVPPELWDKVFRVATDLPESFIAFLQDYGESKRNLLGEPYQQWKQATATRASICCVSRQWNAIGTPLLYEYIIISTTSHTERGNRLKALMRTVRPTSAGLSEGTSNPHKGALIRGIDFSESLSEASRSRSGRKNWRQEISGQVTELVRCLPNLEVFSIETRRTICPLSTLDALSPHLKHLYWRTLPIMDHGNQALSTSRILCFLEGHSSLQTVDIMYPFTLAPSASSPSSSLWNGQPFPSIRHWVLSETHVHFLAALSPKILPNLHTITYSSEVSGELPKFAEFLSRQGQNLNVVRIDTHWSPINFLQPVAQLCSQVSEVHLVDPFSCLRADTFSQVSAVTNMPRVATLNLSFNNHYEIPQGDPRFEIVMLGWRDIFPNLRIVKLPGENDLTVLKSMLGDLDNVIDHYRNTGLAFQDRFGNTLLIWVSAVSHFTPGVRSNRQPTGIKPARASASRDQNSSLPIIMPDLPYDIICSVLSDPSLSTKDLFSLCLICKALVKPAQRRLYEDHVKLFSLKSKCPQVAKSLDMSPHLADYIKTLTVVSGMKTKELPGILDRLTSLTTLVVGRPYSFDQRFRQNSVRWDDITSPRSIDALERSIRTPSLSSLMFRYISFPSPTTLARLLGNARADLRNLNLWAISFTTSVAENPNTQAPLSPFRLTMGLTNDTPKSKDTLRIVLGTANPVIALTNTKVVELVTDEAGMLEGALRSLHSFAHELRISSIGRLRFSQPFTFLSITAVRTLVLNYFDAAYSLGCLSTPVNHAIASLRSFRTGNRVEHIKIRWRVIGVDMAHARVTMPARDPSSPPLTFEELEDDGEDEIRQLVQALIDTFPRLRRLEINFLNDMAEGKGVTFRDDFETALRGIVGQAPEMSQLESSVTLEARPTGSVKPAQRRIYEDIRVGKKCRQLGRAVESSPHLAGYIKKLTVVSDFKTKELPGVLDRATTLQTLVIGKQYDPRHKITMIRWADMSQQFIQALERAVGRPSLSSLALRYFSFPSPMTSGHLLVNAHSHLSDLSLYVITFVSSVAESPSSISLPQIPMSPPQLTIAIHGDAKKTKDTLRILLYGATPTILDTTDTKVVELVTGQPSDMLNVSSVGLLHCYEPISFQANTAVRKLVLNYFGAGYSQDIRGTPVSHALDSLRTFKASGNPVECIKICWRTFGIRMAHPRRTMPARDPSSRHLTLAELMDDGGWEVEDLVKILSETFPELCRDRLEADFLNSTSREKGGVFQDDFETVLRGILDETPAMGHLEWSVILEIR
ncbi:hypothetical protein NMY22_g8536 [Coprinellus aureogranulatus]|nr:hypothetical protein NMY22_g8536 [Coprinellus aureogranulatus]